MVISLIETFQSKFSERITAFIRQKKLLGFPYVGSTGILRMFDLFCLKHFPAETALTKEICLSWAVRRDTEQIKSFYTRLSPIREFAKYLNGIGEPAFIIPKGFVCGAHKHVPYIYTEEEITRIWQAFDEIVPRKRYPVRHLVLPAMVRLLYCCGLRPVEARKLKTCDINLHTGKIFIRESKGYKDRIVMLADDALEYFNAYNEKVCRLMPGREWFFPRSNDSLQIKDCFQDAFKKVRVKLGLEQSGSTLLRLYDFRHTFATHRLYLWMREGKDLTAMLPYLCAYMGHSQLSDTYYYIHLVPGQLETMSGLDFSKYESLLPEAGTDE
jgi:integrase